MKRLLADLRAFARQYLRSRMGFFFTFIFPVLLVLLFGALFSSGATAITLPVQDLDNSAMSRTFVNILNQTNVVKPALVSPDKDLQAYIKAESLTVALQIPQGFQDNIQQGTRTNVTVYGDPSTSTTNMVNGVVNAVVQQMNWNYYVGPQIQPVVGMEVKSVVSSRFEYMDFFLPGIVGMTVMTNTMFSMPAVCAEYRSRRFFKLLSTTTITKAEWIASKILFYMLLTIGSLLATVSVGYLVWNVQFTIDLYTIALIIVGVVLFSSIGMLFGSVTKDPESAVAFANILVFPMMFLSGTFWPVNAMPAYLQTFARILPLTFLSDGLRDAMVYANISGVITSLEVLAGLSVLFFALARRFMSWQERT